jgi:hypothetical protein
MEKNLSSIEILLKYIDFIIEYSESILSDIIISDEKYKGLLMESELFCDRVLNSKGIPDSVKSEFLRTKLPEINQKFSIKDFLKSIFIKANSNQNYSDVIENKRREYIQEYLNRMKNFYLLVKVKS